MTSPLTLRIEEAQHQQPLSHAPFNYWHYADGSVWCALYREGDAYRMRFPALADFVIHTAGYVHCTPILGIDEPTIQHLFQTQVAPQALGQQHLPYFHASCVSFNGHALAFLGDSGLGKSTLATYLATHGATLIADDGLALKWENDTYFALPSYQSLRLWDDSRKALIPGNTQTLPPVSYTSKARFSSDGLLPFASHPTPLRCAYFLSTEITDVVNITRLSMREAHIAWVRHSPMLDVHDRRRMASQFDQAARLAMMECSFVLEYPRRYESLHEVSTLIRTHMASV